MEEMKQLVDLLNKYAYDYYVLDKPTISDGEYDKLYDKLSKMERETGVILPNSPTQRVGDVVLENFQKVEHKVRLYSLDKCQSLQELNSWVSSMQQKSNKQKLTLEYKFDGLTIVCTYKNGLFVSAATRGNGQVGEDVTAQVKTIKSVPLKIEYKGELIVQGEGIITISNLKKFNEKYPKEALKNARNAVSGAIRNLDSKQTAKRNLDWICYNVCFAQDKTFKSQEDMFEFLKQNHFKVSPYKVVTTFDEIEKEINKVDKEKSSLDILIDGMVLKLDDVPSRDDFGYTAKFPKWAMAYKFAPQELSTILKNVVWQVGRTGKITPIAEIEPVVLAGAQVMRATLNNYGDIERKNVEIGSRVFVRRSNEVIPEIMGLAELLPNSRKIEKPIFCPCCHTELVEIGALLFCPNTYGCKEQVVDRMAHFSSRDAMNIEGFSEQTADLIYDKLNVRTFSDLYRLKYENLVNLPSFKDKKAINLINSINKSKNVNFENFIFALGISNIGKKTAKDLTKYYQTLDDLKYAKVEDLSSIRDIGDIVANSVVQYFKDDKNLQIIDELINLGVNIIYKSTKTGDLLKGKTFVLTGTLEKYSRSDATKIIEDLGGQTSTSVSKNTSYVLAGSEPGSKLTKAQMLGVTILTEQEFDELIKK